MEQVILVDNKDRQTGIEEKMKAHQEGKLHRAFSVFIFNSKGELMLQKRASSKYHSGGLWTNTCCSHPRPKEKTIDAASRRLREEMGFICVIEEVLSFAYKAKFENGLIENEYDHVFTGKFNGIPFPDSDEVEDWRWMSIDDLKKELKYNPEKYTYWLRKIIGQKAFHNCIHKKS